MLRAENEMDFSVFGVSVLLLCCSIILPFSELLIGRMFTVIFVCVTFWSTGQTCLDNHSFVCCHRKRFPCRCKVCPYFLLTYCCIGCLISLCVVSYVLTGISRAWNHSMLKLEAWMFSERLGRSAVPRIVRNTGNVTELRLCAMGLAQLRPRLLQTFTYGCWN